MRSSSRFWRCISLALLLSLTATAHAADEPLIIGMLAYRPAEEVQARWTALADYLSGRLGKPVVLRAMSYRDLEEAIEAHRINFVFTNSSHYLLMTYRNGLSSPLVTLVERGGTQGLQQFGGVVFTLAARDDLQRLQDLRGRRVAAVTRGSLGGFQAQARELADLGLRIPGNIALIETGMPHDRAIEAVLAGKADAGFARTGVIEQMIEEGRLSPARLKVIGAVMHSNFPFTLSTRLYPEWPIAAMPRTDGTVARQLAAELLSLPHDGSLSRRLGIIGFTIPPSYESLAGTLRELRLPPFDHPPRFELDDIWHRYRQEIVGGALLAALVAMLALRLATVNRLLKTREQLSSRSAEKWHGLLTALGEGVFGVDRTGNCTFVNPVALEMLGFEESELLGHDQHRLFHRHHGDHPLPESSCPIRQTLTDGRPRSGEDWFHRKGGYGFPVMLTTAPISDEDGGVVVVFRDISEQQAREQQLLHEATTDELTGVANRRMFLSELDSELKRFQRFAEAGVVLMTDIDHFKQVNDTYGHGVGDQVLRHYASASEQSLRDTDLFGRLGGEEFGILLPVTDTAHALEFAERYRRLIADDPAPTDAGPLPYTISIGLAAFRPGDTATALLARADDALYAAKAGGRNRVCCHRGDDDVTTPAMDTVA